jgi:hypothetical protein
MVKTPMQAVTASEPATGTGADLETLNITQNMVFAATG